MTHKLAVKGIIRRNDGKILIVKRSKNDDHLPGVWETVGGTVEEGATPEEALIREIMEEVGLDVEVGELFNVFNFTKDNGEKKIGITFLCNYLSRDVMLSEEHSDFQ
ncbi:MAG: NUDIX hydrolase [Parcubacteria group bacterium GW2011_GWE2_39_37]|nr:MAG: NUDIX hydrolase [Parcubacteria group bacterium GW2011_GWE2_39_37]